LLGATIAHVDVAIVVKAPIIEVNRLGMTGAGENGRESSHGKEQSKSIEHRSSAKTVKNILAIT
jgi:hypothetical protein